jgi:AcrR family transcriptional regulator
MMAAKTSEKRRNIIKAAVALFSRAHDVRKVSLEDIAKEAGVSPTTIYNYFGTRDNLVTEVARELVHEMMEKMREVNDADLPFPQKVSDMFSGKMDFIGRNSALLPKLLSQNASIITDSVNMAEMREMSGQFFDSGKKQGYIDQSLDNQTILDYFDILRAGVAAKPELAARFQPGSPLVTDLTRLIFYGLLQKDIGHFDA